MDTGKTLHPNMEKNKNYVCVRQYKEITVVPFALALQKYNIS